MSKQPKLGDPAISKEWDASNPNYSTMADNCWRDAVMVNKKAEALTKQDALNAYAYAHFFDVFKDVINDMVGQLVTEAQPIEQSTSSEPQSHTGYYALPLKRLTDVPDTIYGPYDTIKEALDADDGGARYWRVVKGVFYIEQVVKTVSPDGES